MSEDMAIDWTKLFKQYRGEWVALKDDEKSVIAHGKNAKSVLKEASSRYERPILMKVPTKVTAYIG